MPKKDKGLTWSAILPALVKSSEGILSPWSEARGCHTHSVRNDCNGGKRRETTQRRVTGRKADLSVNDPATRCPDLRVRQRLLRTQ